MSWRRASALPWRKPDTDVFLLAVLPFCWRWASPPWPLRPKAPLRAATPLPTRLRPRRRRRFQGQLSVQARIKARRAQRRAAAIHEAYSHSYEIYTGMGYLRFLPGPGVPASPA